MVDSQRAWIQRRNDDCSGSSKASCIGDAYVARIKELQEEKNAKEGEDAQLAKALAEQERNKQKIRQQIEQDNAGQESIMPVNRDCQLCWSGQEGCNEAGTLGPDGTITTQAGTAECCHVIGLCGN
ncbi:DUF3450 domain-containing protein [Mesorhizobium sp. M1163]